MAYDVPNPGDRGCSRMSAIGVSTAAAKLNPFVIATTSEPAQGNDFRPGLRHGTPASDL